MRHGLPDNLSHSILIAATVVILPALAVHGEAAAQRPALVVQNGHARGIVGLAIDPGGQVFATTDETTVKVWDLASGALLQSYDAGQGRPILAVASRGRHIVAARQSLLTIWTPQSNAATRTLNVDCLVEAAEFRPDGQPGRQPGGLPDGQRLVLACTQPWILVVDVVSGQAERHAFPLTPGGDARGVANPHSLALSRDGRAAAVARADGSVWVFDFSTRTGRSIAVDQKALSGIAFSPDTSRIAVGSFDVPTVRIVELASANVIATRTWPVVQSIRGVSEAVMAGFRVGIEQVRWVNAGPGAILVNKRLHEGLQRLDATTLADSGSVADSVASGVFAAHDTLILFASMNKMYGSSLHAIDVTKDTPRYVIDGRFRATPVAFAGDGSIMASTADDFVTVWRLSDGTVACTSRSDAAMISGLEGVNQLAISPDNKKVAAVRSSGVIDIWDVDMCAAVRTLRVSSDVVVAAAWLDSMRIAAGANGGDVVELDVATGAKTVLFKANDFVRALAFDGERLISGDGKGELLAWSFTDRRVTWSEHFSAAGGVVSLSASAKAGVVAVGVGDGIRIRRLRDGAALHEKLGLPGEISANAAGTVVGFARPGQSAGFWEISTGKVSEVPLPAGSECRSIVLHPAALYAAVTCVDSTVRIVPIPGHGKMREIADLFAWRDGRSASFVNRTGHFDASDIDGMTADLHWVFPDQPLRALPPEIFMRDYYEPRLLPRLLTGAALPEVPPLDTLNRVQPMVTVERVTWTDRANGRAVVTVKVGGAEESFDRNGRAETETTGVYDVRLFRDGQLVGWAPLTSDQWQRERPGLAADGPRADLSRWRELTGVTLEADRTARLEFPVRIARRADQSDVTFTAYAFNEDRVKSATARLRMTLPTEIQPRQGRAYVITAGVNRTDAGVEWDLDYAVKDAREMSRVVAARLDALEQFAPVVQIRLVSDRETSQADERPATQTYLQLVLDRLAGRPVDATSLAAWPALADVHRAEPDDVVVLAVSSHGYTNANGTFQLLLADAHPPTIRTSSDSPSNGSSKTVAVDLPQLPSNTYSSDALSRALRDIDAGDIVLIVDACQSETTVQADGFKPGPMGSRGLGQLAYDKGMRVLAASKAKESAIERGGNIKHGLLTYALIERGLNDGAADFRPVDRAITLGEWLAYAVDGVPALFREGDTTKGIIATDKNGNRTRDAYHGQKRTPPSYQQPVFFDFNRSGRQIFLSR